MEIDLELFKDLFYFILVSAIFGILTNLVANHAPSLFLMNNTTAYLSYLLVRSLGFPVGYGVSGGEPYVLIACPNKGIFRGCASAVCLFKFFIVNECSAYVAIFAVLGITLGIRKRRMLERIRASFLLSLAIYSINVIRIATMAIIVQRFGCQLFDLLHILVWREVLLAFAILLWWLWLTTSE